MARILVTGATGFIGGHLTRRLVELGHRVRCLVRPTSQVESLRQLPVELVNASLFEPQRLAEVVADQEWVFHLAGMTAAFRRAHLMEVNANGAANVAEACAKQPHPPVLVLVSSVAAAGPSPRGHVKTEEEPAQPISNYGRSKYAGEVAARRWADQVPLTIVRPGIVFGAEGVEILPMFRAIRRIHVHAIAGFRSPPLSVIYVDELVELLVRAAEQGQRVPTASIPGASIPGASTPGASTPGAGGAGCYFACRPEHPDYLEFGRMLHQAIGTRHTSFLHFPKPVAWLIGGVGECIGRVRRKPFGLNVDKIRESLVESWACSCAAAVRDLGYAPQDPLLDQLRRTADWYREHKWL